VKLIELAQKLNLNLDLIDFKNRENEIVENLNTLKDASNSEVSFLENKNYIADLGNTKALAVLVNRENSDLVPENTVSLISDEPYISLAKASFYFFKPLYTPENEKNEPYYGKNAHVEPNSYIGNNVKIGENTVILANSYIGDNVEIGDNSVIYPNVTIYRDTQIGNNVIIHAGSVIGSDGYGFATNKRGEHTKIYQNGFVQIEDEVEIGGNCSIDRGVFSATKIKKGAKLDNLVHIAHNVEVGEFSLLTGQIGISGSTKLGRNVVMGGQSGISGHLEIAPFTTITAKAGITNNIKEPHKIWSGFPFFEHRKWLRLQAKISKLIKK
jgi:UDP-3-O-[3-hydroxymyristoyl] glucosamine N-acyltransferase